VLLILFPKRNNYVVEERNELREQINQSQNEIKTLNETLNEPGTNLDHLELQVQIFDEKIKELKGEKTQITQILCGFKSSSLEVKMHTIYVTRIILRLLSALFGSQFMLPMETSVTFIGACAILFPLFFNSLILLYDIWIFFLKLSTLVDANS
jgi:hypothetical protein